MSYRCPQCQGALYERKVAICPHCGAGLPPDALFVPSGTLASDAEAEGVKVPVVLLARAWCEMSKARGDAKGSRRAAARYLRDGMVSGLPCGLLLKWLFFWPNERESAFGQAGYSAQAGKDFINMVKELRIQEVLAFDEESQVPGLAGEEDSDKEKIWEEAKAEIMWGEPAPAVRDFLTAKGLSANDVDTRVQEFTAARNAEIRRMGVRSVVVGLAILCGGGAILYPCFRYFDSLTHVNRPIFLMIFAAVGSYGMWKLVCGAAWFLRPQAEHKSVSDVGG